MYSQYTELLGVLVDEVVKVRRHKYGEINIANSIEQNLHWERNSLSVSQEISLIIWQPHV
jgi:hypothetical protein